MQQDVFEGRVSPCPRGCRTTWFRVAPGMTASCISGAPSATPAKRRSRALVLLNFYNLQSFSAWTTYTPRTRRTYFEFAVRVAPQVVIASRLRLRTNVPEFSSPWKWTLGGIARTGYLCLVVRIANAIVCRR
jgi:hypothetical protein